MRRPAIHEETVGPLLQVSGPQIPTFQIGKRVRDQRVPTAHVLPLHTSRPRTSCTPLCACPLSHRPQALSRPFQRGLACLARQPLLGALRVLQVQSLH